jgi:PAS domain S-box-containing protein
MLNLLCSPDGVVVSQAPPRAEELDEFDAKPPADKPADDWRSNGTLSKSLGSPLVKTWWFDHVDCDQRELQQVLRAASKGKHSRVRVWMRMTDSELVRAELTATPLLNATGEVANLMVRTEPTGSMQRRREAQRKPSDEPVIKPYRAAEAPSKQEPPAPADLLALRLPVPLLRLDLATGTVLGANDALADLLGHADRSTCTRIPLTELVPPADRAAVAESIGNLARGTSADRTIETRLKGATDRELHARLLLFADASSPTPQTMLAVVRDVSADRLMMALMQRADVQTRAAQLHEAKLERLQQLLTDAPAGLALIDAGGAVVEANTAMQRLTSQPLADAKTSRPRRGKPTPEGDAALVLSTLARDAIGSRSTKQSTLSLADGRTIALLASPLNDKLASVVAIDASTISPPRDVLADVTVDALLAMPAFLSGVIAPDGRLLRANDALRAALAIGDATEPPVTDVIAPASRTAFGDVLAAARSAKPTAAQRIELLSADGRLVSASVALVAIEPDEPAHVLLIANDLSVAESTLSQQRARVARLESVAQRQPIALISVARSNGVITAVNPAAAELLSAGVDRLVGQPMPRVPQAIADAIRGGRSATASRVAIGESTVDVVALPAGDESDVLLIDRTDVVALERKLAAGDSRAAALADAQSVGIVEWDIVTGDIRASSRAVELVACKPEPGNTSALFASIDRTDRETLERALFDAMEQTSAGSALDVQLRAAGKPIRLFGRFAFETENGHAFPVRAVLVALDDAPTVHRASLEANIVELKSTVTARDAELDDRLAKLKQKDERIEQCDAAIADRDRQIESLQNQLESRSSELGDRSKELAERARELADRDRAARLRTAELNAIVEAMQGSLRLQSDGSIRTSEAASRLFGANASQLFDDPAAWASAMKLARLDGQPIAPDELPVVRAKSSRSTASADLVMRTGDGREASVRTTAAPVLLDGEVVGVACIDTDRTELRDAQSTLAARERELEQLFDTASLGMAQVAPDGTVRRANRQLAVILGLPAEEIAGKQLKQLTMDDDRKAIERLADVFAGRAGEAGIDLGLLRRDGQPVPTHITFVAARPDYATAIVQDLSLVRESLRQKESLEADLADARARLDAALKATGEGVLLLDADLKPLESNPAARRLLGVDDGAAIDLASIRFTDLAGKNVAAGKLPWGGKDRAAIDMKPGSDGITATYAATRLGDGRIVLTIRDATQRIALQEEVQRTQARVIEAHTLMQSRSSEQAERLSAVVRQLRSPASIASAPARALVAGEQRLPADLRDAATSLLGLVTLQTRLAEALPDAARIAAGDASERETVDVHAVLREAIRVATESHNGRRIELKSDAGASARVRVATPAVRHAIGSLLGEAIRRSTNSANIGVSTQIDSAADRVRVTIDTNNAIKGTADEPSLDESVARTLLQADGGTLDTAMATGKGRTWRIEFPLASDAAPTTPAAETVKPVKPLRVLLVEDHESTARVISRQLVRLGCAVEVARSIAEADGMLDRKLDTVEPFGLIVSDLTLPDGSASEFMSRAASRHAIPGVALRGYGSQDDEQLLRAAGFVDLLMKPVDLNALSTAIRKIRGGSSEA